MTSLIDLWLPIGASAIAVFVVSALLWMAIPLHNKDVQRLPDEASVKAIARTLKPGFYMFPNIAAAAGEDSKAVQDRYKQGPWGVMTVWPKAPSFPLNLIKTFTVFLLICILVAYLTSAGVGIAPSFMSVFQLAAVASLLGFTFGGLPNDIFFGKPTRFCITSLIEAIIYSLVVAVIMALLWPGRA